MNYNSFNDFLKEKIGTEIIIADEQAYDMLNDNITVIIKYLRGNIYTSCLLYTSPSPRDRTRSRMPSSA